MPALGLLFTDYKNNHEQLIMSKKILLFLSLCCFAASSYGQLSPSAIWAAEATVRYQQYPNEIYQTENGIEMTLDVYARRDVATPQPTLVFLHGGFWVRGSKDTQLMALMPWLEMGWNVVNVEYRLGGVAPAPAALVDSYCALRFVAANAERFNVDTSRIVVSGQSAGGHLALSVGLMADAGFDESCPAGATPAVAAVVNWYGVTDVPDVISGQNRSDAAASWFAGIPQREVMPLAEKLSPLGYVRDNLPPIMTVQGDNDQVVPYAHGVALHEALNQTNVTHQLLTIPGGGHGGFTGSERQHIYSNIQAFLTRVGLR